MAKDSTATVESRIRDILSKEHCVDVIDSSEPFEHAGLDSLDRVELWMQVETEFGLPETDPDDEDECETLLEMVAYVTKKTAH